ncbi:cupin domain-containing protein [Pseudobacter ginsenosidimutans]|uniref:Cupin domain n=1 Tax=Pseudobacter ginsenosidimutans TaxID=661488 RepID=A0A4V2F0R2_9BACT|nr:cupin domain-containing protein [Pseudobacter ginsenosidimutans]QEC42138.1 cupin domain-containing protein [Pseudobacter ginsenosidimutans]RZS71021.1 cupin domain [Pseudobacter ginsenosidimutans]
MNFNNVAIILLLSVVSFSCNQQNEPLQKTSSELAEAPVFSKGKQITNDNLTGMVWLNKLVEADSLNQTAVGSVTFAAGARTKWHSHPAGQIILALGGIGYYQEKGSPKVIVKKGDVVKCPPGIPHWHGASTETEFVQVAITGREKGETIWLESVSEEEYRR